MFSTAAEIYNLLIQDNLTNSEGEIVFNFLNVSTRINEKSAIGDLFQEWLSKWLESRNIQYRTKPNTQDFPDFLLDRDSHTKGLLEIKTFDSDRSANFDVANFEAYCRSLKNNAYRLDADYLIFSYKLVDYKFSVDRVWLKKIWQITGPSQQYPVKCQVKQKTIYNIRPISWYSTRGKYKEFSTRKEFVTALYETLIKYEKTKNENQNWLNVVEQNYLDFTGERL